MSFKLSKLPNTKSKKNHQDKEPQMAPESESDAILSQAKNPAAPVVGRNVAFWRY